jgi:hypothetical protein
VWPLPEENGDITGCDSVAEWGTETSDAGRLLFVLVRDRHGLPQSNGPPPFAIVRPPGFLQSYGWGGPLIFKTDRLSRQPTRHLIVRPKS